MLREPQVRSIMPTEAFNSLFAHRPTYVHYVHNTVADPDRIRPIRVVHSAIHLILNLRKFWTLQTCCLLCCMSFAMYSVLDFGDHSQGRVDGWEMNEKRIGLNSNSRCTSPIQKPLRCQITN